MAENRTPILRLDKICKSFGGVVTAKEVTFCVYPGEIKGLIGPNGAGKTTMMNMISGIYTADSGDVYFNEEKITDPNARFCCADCGGDGVVIRKGKKVFYCARPPH